MAVSDIRDARPEDLDSIVEVFLTCWQTGYRGMLPAADVEHWNEAKARELWRSSFAMEGQRVVVALSEGRIVGIARLGIAPDDAACGFLHSLYIHPEASRKGVGGDLLRFVEVTFVAAGFLQARLWVFAANAPAIAFYRRSGWRGDGRTRHEADFAEPQIGMCRRLGPGRAMDGEMAAQPNLLERLIQRRQAMVDSVREAVPQSIHGIVLLARGSSDNAAVYGRYALEFALRQPVALAAPSLWSRYGLEQDLRGHLAIAVSQSGRTPEIVTTLDALRGAGATTIAITNDGSAPIGSAADVTIDLQMGLESAVPATKTFTAQVAAFGFVAEALGNPPWTAADWEEVPRAQAAVIDDPQPAVEAAVVIAGARGSLHVARGPLYAVALESALKLSEASAMPATGFSSADFLHGPVAAAGPSMSVIAYLAPGPVANDVRAAAEAARRAGAPLVVVAAEPPPHGLHVPVPSGVTEWLAPLVHAVRAQQLAEHTALHLGVDPDRPGGLSKITMTA